MPHQLTAAASITKLLARTLPARHAFHAKVLMLDSPVCPVCSSRDLQTIGERTWTREEIETADEYRQHRLRVLFELWQPQRDLFVATWRLCDQCGLVTYWSRPTADEIDAKYRYLVAHTNDPIPPVESDYNRLRVARLTAILKPHLQPYSRLLDFGGGDGRLLQTLAEEGHECAVVDYVETQVPSVAKLGDTLDDVPADTAPFDAAVCSHVLEHVADPVGLLRSVRDFVRPAGIVYVELPMEVWKGTPRVSEPVTHVNYFTAESTRRLLQESGLQPIRVQTKGLELPTPSGGQTRSVVVSALGRVASDVAITARGGNASRRLIDPDLLTRARYASLHPAQLGRTIVGRVVPRWLRTS